VWRYVNFWREPEGFRERMRELATQRPRFGCPRIHTLLRREGFAVNHNRMHRIDVEEQLQIRRRGRRKVAGRAQRKALPTPDRPHVRWSMDFVSDCLHDGRANRVLIVIDNDTRVAVMLEVDFSVPGEHVARALDRAASDGSRASSTRTRRSRRGATTTTRSVCTSH